MKLTNNFSKSEFDSKDGAVMPCEILENIRKLAEILQIIRDNIKKPITINSGYRSPEHNKSIGGVSNSQHVKGLAADITVQDYTPDQVADFIGGLMNYGVIEQGGLGRYNTFTHIDIRGKKARWDNRK